MKNHNGVTLVELIIVLSILAALSTLLIPLCGNQLQAAGTVATQATLVEVKQALQDYWHDTKFVALNGVTTVAQESERFQLNWLFRNPVTGDTTVAYDPNVKVGWNGPYLAVSNMQFSSVAMVDAWNQELVVQYVNPADSMKDVRIVSPGPNGVLEISSSVASSSLTSGSIGDDLYVAITLR